MNQSSNGTTVEEAPGSGKTMMIYAMLYLICALVVIEATLRAPVMED